MTQSTLNMTNKQKRELAKAMFAPATAQRQQQRTVQPTRAASLSSVRQGSRTVTSARAAAPTRRQQRAVTSARAALSLGRQQHTVPSTRVTLTAAEKAARRLQAEQWARDVARRRGLDYDDLEDEAGPSPPVVNGAEAAVRPQPQQPVCVETAARSQSQQRRRRRTRCCQASSPVVETVSEDWRVGSTTEWDEPVVMVPVAVAEEEEQFWDAAQFVEPRPKAGREERRRARTACVAAIRLEGEVSRAASRRKLDEELRQAEQHLAHLRRLGRHQMIRLVLTGVFQAALVVGAVAVASSW